MSRTVKNQKSESASAVSLAYRMGNLSIPTVRRRLELARQGAVLASVALEAVADGEGELDQTVADAVLKSLNETNDHLYWLEKNLGDSLVLLAPNSDQGEVLDQLAVLCRRAEPNQKKTAAKAR